MFSGFFNYDNPVWRFIGKFFDIMVLNFLWMICSIPVVTIGASTTAVYYVTLKLVRDEEGGTVKSFFKSFKENFRQATVIWLILLAAGAVIGFDLYFFLRIQNVPSVFRTVMLALFIGFGIIWLCITLFAFPLQSRFYNPMKKTLFNAFFMSMRHFLQSIGILAADVALLGLTVVLMPILQPMLFLFGFPLFAYMNSFMMAWIFDKYTPKEEVHHEAEDVWEMDSKETENEETDSEETDNRETENEETDGEETDSEETEDRETENGETEDGKTETR